MPCTECGTSAREEHAGVVGGEFRYDEDGTAHYVCLSSRERSPHDTV